MPAREPERRRPAGWLGGVSPPLHDRPLRGTLTVPPHVIALVPARMRHDNFISPDKALVRKSRGRLPHWQLDEATYSITFRLRDSLPHHIAITLFREREQMLRMTMNASERAEVDRLFGLKLDSYLDQGFGSCILREDGNAQIVADALRYFDRARYELHAWCIMPNHVHAMMYLQRGADLDKVLHSWKSFAAHRIGRGVIWQPEYYDRIIRNANDFWSTRTYILNNPTKAGLREWKWMGVSG
jgi:REP element-mobilizing transposase RayT